MLPGASGVASAPIAAYSFGHTAYELMELVPVFNPPMKPAPGSRSDPTPRVQVERTPGGYDTPRKESLKYLRQAQLNWPDTDDATREYIEGFFQQFSGGVGPFIWQHYDPTPTPPYAATLEGLPSGSITTDEYFVAFTWYTTDYGETKRSVEAAITLPSNYRLKVTVPAFPQGVEGFKVYVGNVSGTLYLQDTVNSARYSLLSSLTLSGTQPPSTNTLYPRTKWILEGRPEVSRSQWDGWAISMSLKEQLY